MPAPLHWQSQIIRMRFIGEKCGCGQVVFPPRDICPECNGRIREGGGSSFGFSIKYGEGTPREAVIFSPHRGSKERG